MRAKVATSYSHHKSESFKSLVKTHQFVKCTKVRGCRPPFQNQDCVWKNNIGRNYNINKINDSRDVYQFTKKKKTSRFHVKGEQRGERKMKHEECKAKWNESILLLPLVWEDLFRLRYFRGPWCCAKVFDNLVENNFRFSIDNFEAEIFQH